MTDTTPPDYKDTVFLPRTDFPMKAGLPQKEPGILADWQRQDLYAQVRAARAGRPTFILHDGPPYANGDMHIGHALNHILKDMVCRTQTLLGRDAPYVPGWDCHGLPIEWKVEEEYRKKKRNKDEVPPAEFRAECRAYAQKWVDIQREQLKRLGILGDWDHPYLTMDFAAEATIVAELLKFAASGQLYRGAKPVMWSPVEKTALAEAEVEYEEITSTQIDVAFEIVEAPNAEDLVGAYAVIWTTTPWTIPVNQAIAYGEDVEYVAIKGKLFKPVAGLVTSEDENKPVRDMTIVVAADLWDKIRARASFIPDNCLYSDGPIWRGKGFALAGAKARHPMAQYFERFPGEGRGPASLSGVGNSDAVDPGLRRGDGSSGAGAGLHINPASPLAEFFLRPRPFLPGDFVTTDAGTGLVHMAPDHGEDDFALCKAHGLNPVFAVEADGRYRADWAWLGGQGSVINPKFNAPDGPICADLRAAGALLAASADFRHSYPHSWRSKQKVIYRCTPQWFVPMDKPLEPSPPRGEGWERGEDQNAALLHRPSPEPAAQGHPLPDGEREDTLRTRALAAIAATRFVPDKGRNRIGAMVETRPDWVLSRQRAWGVPITLFVDRRTGAYLNDPAVNARIVAAVRERGVDAWTDEAAPALLGPDYDPADYERVTDILDVWFDSGCTHAFVLESGRWPALAWPADLYLEGSDQHRGWFQSSLLESCGTRGRAPYDAVLTHGFTMDAKGLKMSKSLGNTINPVDLMRDYGADILRLWALSVDFTEDHRIGKEILGGVADQYRKLRNTFRYLLGALDGFDAAERVADVAAMPELERYVLHLLADLDARLRAAVEAFDFNTYTRLIGEFANNDLSAFFFDIRKDCLYCDVNPVTGWQSDKRRAYRTVLDILFHALVRYAAPVLVFTAEEVWRTRFGEGGSVHLLEWPKIPNVANGKWNESQPALSQWRRDINRELETLRRDKVVGSSLEAAVTIYRSGGIPPRFESVDLAEAFIVSEVFWVDDQPPEGAFQFAIYDGSTSSGIGFTIERSSHHKCGRCWRHLPEVTVDGALCDRCAGVLAA